MGKYAALAALVVWGILAGHASAQWEPWPSTWIDQCVPYFAQHPPVYYSQAVPRTYGYSPYPYPPGVLTPDPAPLPRAPRTIPNPFVGGAYGANPWPGGSIPAPLLIINPYVKQ
jgi:hypothetical protein